ncbi:MAG: hypothetical protein KAS75_05805 [Planctomycetes bacterium]|nr:hypothetical protein [Planctomycetota bacterium]
MRVVTIILLGFLLCLAAGCDEAAREVRLLEKINTLKQEKKQLANQIEQSEIEKEKLKEQAEVLAGLSSEVRLANLYDLQKVKLTKYTNLYDKDKDGKKEKLIVYLQPVDEEDDIVKASGTVDVELWDLNRNGEAMLGKWQVGPEELKKRWFATLVTINYRLVFDVGGKITDEEEELVVKVTFTDYLAGKVFKQQKIIKP